MSIKCNCGVEVFGCRVSNWTDYSVIDWGAEMKCSKCLENRDVEKTKQRLIKSGVMMDGSKHCGQG